MEDQGPKPEPAVPVKVKPRLRLSLFDFNPSFLTEKGVFDEDLLEAFKVARIDDYSLVKTISFDNAEENHLKWDSGFTPIILGSDWEAKRIGYLQRLTQKMHDFGAQVIAGYELVERDKIISERGTLFRSWLASATPKQVSNHAEHIVDFFISRQIPIDGIGFDFELNGLGSAHKSNLELLFNKTARFFADARPDAFVYYDTSPFQPNDGEGSSPNMKVLKYSLANGAENLIARPMCYNRVVKSESEIKASINCALSTGDGGGGLTPSHLQYAIDVSRTSDSQVESMCTNLFRSNLVGMTVYTMPGRGGQRKFLTKVAGFEALLNPGSPPPGALSEPRQVPHYGF